MTATADLPNKEIADFTEKLSFVSWDMWFILDSEDSFILKKINKTLMVGATWATGASFIFRWAYSWATDYVVNDTVTYDGSSYINILASTDNLPTNATYWELLAAKGTDWAGTWDMLKADNLSELANNATARTNIWLGNVDNTADTAKPVSTAQQTALNLKANIASPTFTGTVAGITKAMVWLSSVDDTSDATKNSATVTLSNKRITSRIWTTTTAATITPVGDSNDMYTVTALAEATTIAAPSGTPTDWQKLMIRIKDDATARALTWNAIYRVIWVTLPTTTVLSKTHYIGCVYNTADTKRDVLAVGVQA